MVGAGAIKAGKALVSLELGQKGFSMGLGKASKKLKAFGSSVGAIGKKLMAAGAVMAAPLVGATVAFMKMGDAMQKMAARTGVSVESLSQLKFAASQSGTTIEGLEKSIMKMNRLVLDAGRGLATATDAFGMLGISADSLVGVAPDEALKMIAQKLSEIEDPAKKAALAMMVFGKSGVEMIPMIENGAAGINDLMKEADELGLTMAGKDADAAAKLTDEVDKMTRLLKQTVFVIGAALAPLITEVAELFVKWGKKIKAFADDNREMVILYAKIVAGVMAAGVAFLAFGVIISLAGTAVGALAAVVATVIGVIAAFVSPLGIVVGLIAAVIGATQGWGKASKNMAAVGKASFGNLANIATDTFGGIKDALASGEWKLAAKIAWAGIKAGWLSGTQSLREAWVGFKGWWQGMVLGMSTWFKKSWNKDMSMMKMGWQATKSKFMGEDPKVLAARLNMTKRSFADKNKQIDKENAARKDQINEEAAAGLAKIEAGEAAARAELESLNAIAKKKRDDRKAELEAETEEIPDIVGAVDIPDIAIPGIGEFNASVKSLNLSATSAAAAGRLGQNLSRATDEQIADATARAAVATETLVKMWGNVKGAVAAFVN